MKKKIVTITILLALVVAYPVMAKEAHHPASGDTSTAQMDIEKKIDSSIMKMKEMRMNMGKAQGKSDRRNLMHEHMQMMKNGMQMMETIGGKGMMGGQGSMMTKNQNNRLQMMEKKMQIMREMMNGMMAQQEMMMKNK